MTPGTQRFAAVFARLRRRGRKALIPFVQGGDPDLDTTRRALLALQDAGADVLEVGIPFSDPLADGPTIQRASTRALARGTTPQSVLALVASLKRQLHAPVVVLSYWNPIQRYGDDHGQGIGSRNFLQAAARAGVAGLVIPDLPLEEAQAFRTEASRAGIATILLAAPTSAGARLRQIARQARGFIYYVSVTGTTGVRRRLTSEWEHGVNQLKLVTTTPICVGFGISTPRQAARVARIADGVIIGSALVAALEAPGLRSPEARARRAGKFLRPFRWAI